VEGEATVLLTRTPHRAKNIFALELRTAAAKSGLEVNQQLMDLGGGLWYLPTLEGGNIARNAFYQSLPALASVRRKLRPICGAGDMAGLILKLTSLRLKPAAWRLTIDSLFPSVTEEHVPWLVSAAHSNHTMAIAKAIDNGLDTFAPDDPAVHLVLVEHKDGFLLGVERPEAEDPQITLWLKTWHDRNFGFSASLEPGVAVAMIHIGLAAAQISQPDDGPVARGSVRILDPCTGSGTVSAAARVMGFGSVWSSDVRPQFICKARSNWESCAAVPGLDGPVMGPEWNPHVSPPTHKEPGGKPAAEWLDSEQIQRLLRERDEFRHVKKDRDSAFAIENRLVAAGLTMVEKTRGHQWGTWKDPYGRCGSHEFEPPAEQIRSEHVSFCHDATEGFPSWVVGGDGDHSVDFVAGNPPWGKNIGSKEDGLNIVKNLTKSFSGGYCTMVLLVSRSCFDALARFDKEIAAYHLVPGGFDAELRIVAPTTEEGESSGRERVEKFSLIHHAEIGQSVLMVMGWVDVERCAINGVVYSSGIMGNMFSEPGLTPDAAIAARAAGGEKLAKKAKVGQSASASGICH